MNCFEGFLMSIFDINYEKYLSTAPTTYINQIYKHVEKKHGIIKVEECLKNGHKNLRPIHLACDRGAVDIIGQLILFESDIDVSSKIGNRPIHMAVSRGHWEVVAILVRENCEIDAVNKNKWTALHFTAYNNHLKASKILLYAGCNTEIKDSRDYTALEVAEFSFSTSVATAIREWKNLVKALNTIKEGRYLGMLDHPGFKKFYINNDIDIPVIIDYMKEVDRYTSVENLVNDLKFYDYLRKHQKEYWLINVDIETINRVIDKDNALIYCFNCDDPCPYFCDILMKLMLDMNQMEENLKKILRIVSLSSSANKNIVAMVRKRQQFIHVKRKAFWNRLHLAVCDDRCDMIEYLLCKHLVNINATDEIGNSPLFLACIHGRSDCARVLLSHGADVNTKNKFGQNLLQIALENGMEDLIKPIINQLTTVESVDKLGHSALDVAIKFGSEDLYDKLISKYKSFNNEITNASSLGFLSHDNYSDILLSISLKENAASLYLKVKGYIPQSLICRMDNHTLQILDETKNSLLHLAAWNLAFKTCEGLIERGADVNQKNVHGNTPMHEVINRYLFDNVQHSEEGFLLTVRVLIQAKADINIVNEHNETALQIVLQFINEKLIMEMIKNSNSLFLERIDIDKITLEKKFELLKIIMPKITQECAFNIITEDFIIEISEEFDLPTIELIISRTSRKVKESVLERLLSSATFKNHIVALIYSLLKNQEDILDNVVVGGGETVLTYFLKNNKSSFCEEFIIPEYATYFINATNSEEKSSLHVTAENKCFKLLEKLLVYTNSCDNKDLIGNTPLALLLKYGTMSATKEQLYLVKNVAKILICKGADINSKNNDGKISINECQDKKLKKKLTEYYKRCHFKSNYNRIQWKNEFQSSDGSCG